MEELIDLLKTDPETVVLTGAGISKESGIPTFREAQTGLWAQYDPMQLASPTAFQADPKLVWDWYQWRRGLIANSAPNDGHTALASLENELTNFTLITQNVDGFHQQAGSRSLLEIHGNIQTNYCFNDRSHDVSGADLNQGQPVCPECGAFLRPGVVWFGENLPTGILDEAWQSAGDAELCISIGTSSLVQPAASLPMVAKSSGAYLVEINPGETPLSDQVDLIIRESAASALPKILRRLT